MKDDHTIGSNNPDKVETEQFINISAGPFTISTNLDEQILNHLWPKDKEK